MSLKKNVLKSGSKCKVTFRLTSEEVGGADKVNLLGCFTNWRTEAIEMKKLKNGDFTVEVSLPVDNTYEFRYVLDDNRWYNDTDADGYLQSDYNSDNCLLLT